MDVFAEKTHAVPAAAPAAPRRRPARKAPRAWNLSSLAGRLTEMSDSGAAPSLTAAAALILQAQQRGEPAAWIGFGNSIFFPPDFAEWGIDLEALPVIRVPDALAASGAADQLLRSGAFGLVVLDLKSETRMRHRPRGEFDVPREHPHDGGLAGAVLDARDRKGFRARTGLKSVPAGPFNLQGWGTNCACTWSPKNGLERSWTFAYSTLGPHELDTGNGSEHSSTATRPQNPTLESGWETRYG